MGLILLNGKQYASSDGANSYPPLIYSDAEREVGVWRDGKPLYQKTVTFGAVSAGTTMNIHSDVTTVDTLVDVDVMCSISGGFIKIPMALLSIQAEWGIAEQSFTKSTGYLRLDFGSERSVTGGFATFWYTKTTDTPGSGKWNTLGGLTHHYSATEHIIGTWIDGKPVYEKTLNLVESDFIKVNSWHWSYNWETAISGYDKIIDKYGILSIKRDGSNHIIHWGSESFPMNNSDTYSVHFSDYYRHAVIRGYPYGNSSYKLDADTINYCVLTILYTKTTD